MKIETKTPSYGIIILAAGSSLRLGQPKQLLEYNGKSLLQHSIDEASGTGVNNIVVVLGANAGQIERKIKADKVRVIRNPGYEEGMASGIRLGIHYLTKAEENMTDGILIMLCDQPFVNSELLIKLMDEQKTSGAPVVASCYKNHKGVPAVFHKSVFPELLDLRGDKGAKGVINKHGEETKTVIFPRGHIDIDTAEDYKNLTAL